MSLEAAKRPSSETSSPVVVYDDGSVSRKKDRVVTEEPMEIRISGGGRSKTVAVTMRTPGADFELAAGFLFAEGVLAESEDVRTISYCRDDDLPPDQLYNIVIVDTAGPTRVDIDSLERHFHMTSACGVCGKASIESLDLRGIQPVGEGPAVAAPVISALPDRLREAQRLFASTGGLHAAGLFDPDGKLVASREDVGRHNAVDKLLGWAFLERKIPLGDHVLMVSGRSSFEIAQKAAVAGIPIVCSVSAPTSLAIDVARTFGMTLVGFVREKHFNVYTGEERILRS